MDIVPALGLALFAAASLPPGTAQAVVLADTDWVVADPDANAVYRVDPEAGLPELISEGGLFRFPTGVAVDGDGFVLVADPDANAIFRVDPSDGSQATVSEGMSFRHPTGVAALPGGDLLVIDADARAIFRVDPDDGSQSFEASTEALPFATGIAFDGSGLHHLADPDANAVYRFDPLLESAELLSQGGALVHATGIGVTSALAFVLADPDANRFVLVDRVTGEQTPAAPSDAFLSPSGVAPVPEPGFGVGLAAGLAWLSLLQWRGRGSRGRAQRRQCRESRENAGWMRSDERQRSRGASCSAARASRLPAGLSRAGWARKRPIRSGIARSTWWCSAPAPAPLPHWSPAMPGSRR